MKLSAVLGSVMRLVKKGDAGKVLALPATGVRPSTVAWRLWRVLRKSPSFSPPTQEVGADCGVTQLQ